jgi:hypothetical protein
MGRAVRMDGGGRMGFVGVRNAGPAGRSDGGGGPGADGEDRLACCHDPGRGRDRRVCRLPGVTAATRLCVGHRAQRLGWPARLFQVDRV